MSSLLLREQVHFVRWRGACSKAHLFDHGVDSASLDVELDQGEVFAMLERGEIPPLLDFVPVCCAEYDKAGAPWTWHTAADCPHRLKLA